MFDHDYKRKLAYEAKLPYKLGNNNLWLSSGMSFGLAQVGQLTPKLNPKSFPHMTFPVAHTNPACHRVSRAAPMLWTYLWHARFIMYQLLDCQNELSI